MQDFKDCRAFEDPLTEVVLFFHHASILLFTTFNKLLRLDKPLVHDAVTKFARTLGNGAFKASAMKTTTLTDIDMSDSEVIYFTSQFIWAE